MPPAPRTRSADSEGRQGSTAGGRRNAGASLVDLGDGVLAVEFHSKKNSIGADTIQMLQAGLKEAAANFQALVVGNDADDFSAGANLMLLLLEAQEGNWDEIDLVVRAFQQVNLCAALQPGARRRRARRPGPGRRVRDRPARRPRAGGCRDLRRPGGGRRRSHPGGRAAPRK